MANAPHEWKKLRGFPLVRGARHPLTNEGEAPHEWAEAPHDWRPPYGANRSQKARYESFFSSGGSGSGGRPRTDSTFSAIWANLAKIRT